MTTRVLIVEDHADSAEFLRLLLEPEGYVVKTAGHSPAHARRSGRVEARRHSDGSDAARRRGARSAARAARDEPGVAGHRRERPRQHLRRGRGDGKRRAQLHRKAAQSQRADGAAAQGGRKTRADSREPPAARRAGRRLDLRPTPRAQQADAPAVSIDQVGRADRCQRADHRRERQRQGSRRDRDPRIEQARERVPSSRSTARRFPPS